MSDPIDAMMECHERIRRFTRGVGLVAATTDWSDERVAVTAARCARYFRHGLPLHGQDEDLSLAPRLRAAGVDERVHEALDAIAAEHVELHAGLAEILDILDAIAEGRQAAFDALVDGHRWLDELLERHLRREEAVIFPAARDLPSRVREAIHAEMRARRQS